LVSKDHISPEEHRTLYASSDGTNSDVLTRKKIVAVIDSIISAPAAYLPWKEMVKICAELGVWSVIDAAHSIGQELDINLSAAKPDFWVSVCAPFFHVHAVD
jgi:selenocysteine lyase/cysteine desulfurase